MRIVAAALVALALAGCEDDKTRIVNRPAVAARVAQPDTAGGNLVLPYRLVGDAGARADILVEFSADDKRTFQVAQEATGVGGTEGTTGLTAGPAPGVQHLFAWGGFPRGTPVTVIVTPLVNGRMGIPGEVEFFTPVAADRFEPNATAQTAATLTAATHADLSIGPLGTDLDNYRYTSSAQPKLVSVVADFRSDVSDLDLFVDEAATGAPVLISDSDDDDEEALFFAKPSEAFILRVESFEQLPNGYTLSITETAVTVDFVETFDGFADTAALLAAGWTVTKNAVSSPDVWELEQPTSAGPGSAYSGTKAIATTASGTQYPSAANESIVTPSVTVTASRVFISFEAFVDTEGAPFDFLTVEVEVNGSGTFTTLATLDGDLTINTDFRQFVIAGPAGLVNGDRIRVAFHFKSDASQELDGVYIDDVRVLSAQ
jgi:hypothetical protein